MSREIIYIYLGLSLQQVKQKCKCSSWWEVEKICRCCCCEQDKYVDKWIKTWLSRPHHFKCFKGYLPQILLGPFLNALTHMSISINRITLHYLLLISGQCPFSIVLENLRKPHVSLRFPWNIGLTWVKLLLI